MVADGRMPKAVQIDGRKVWDRRALDRAFDTLSNGEEIINPWDQLLCASSTKRGSRLKSQVE
jgi:hypothetical protein